jgi:hypothetical protein
MATAPHCWIELEQGWCIDLRLRQWLGDEDDLPHGVFQQSNYPRVRYQGTAWLVPHLDLEDLMVITNDVYDKVKLPWLAERARAATPGKTCIFSGSGSFEVKSYRGLKPW